MWEKLVNPIDVKYAQTLRTLGTLGGERGFYFVFIFQELGLCRSFRIITVTCSTHRPLFLPKVSSTDHPKTLLTLSLSRLLSSQAYNKNIYTTYTSRAIGILDDFSRYFIFSILPPLRLFCPRDLTWYEPRESKLRQGIIDSIALGINATMPRGNRRSIFLFCRVRE